MKKIYLVVPTELDIEGNIESFDLRFSRVFVNYDSAKECLTTWCNDILSQDEELCLTQSTDIEYIIEKHTSTSYGDEWTIPCYKFWIMEKELEV